MEAPSQISKVGLEPWYDSLSDQDKVRVGRYIGGIDGPTPVAFLNELMARAVADHNFKLATIAGGYLENLEMSDSDRFRYTENLIEGLFGSDSYEPAKLLCYRNLALYPKVADDLFGGKPDHLSCRNRLIDILVGVDGSYDEAYDALDRFCDMGLIDAEERDYRKQSLKIHRMQRSFDNVFNYRMS